MNTSDQFNTALLLLRVGFGLMLVAHGVNHWRGGGKIAGTGRWFESLGLKPGVMHAWASVITEIGGGLALAAGLVTPLAAGAGVGLMTVAIVTVHRHNGFFIIKEGWEYTGLIALTCVCIATLGPGQWSLDNAISLDSSLGYSTVGWHGTLISLLAGLGGAGALLAVYWRPAKKQAS